MAGEKQQQRVKVLISGFGNFPDNPVNPAQTLAENLAAHFKNHAGIELRHVILPVAFGSGYAELQRQINAFAPDLVLAFGLRAKGREFDLESTARNHISLKKRKDALGNAPSGPIEPGGPLTVRSRLPLQEIKSALQQEGLPVRISGSAGSYVCNDLFYRLMRDFKGCAGFIHIPYSTEAAQHYTGKKQIHPLPQATLLKGAALIIETAVAHFRRGF